MDPVTRSMREQASGWALDDAAPNTRRLAEQLNVSPRHARRMKAGHPSNRVRQMEKILESVEDAYRVLAHLSAYVKWRTVRKWPTAKLVERWWDLTEAEHEHEAHENSAIQRGDSAETEIRADEREAAIQTERSAVRLELEIRRVNPRSFRADR